MHDTPTVRAVDFNCPSDALRYVALLDAYARDPMGAGQPLPEAVKQRLPADLAANPAARCLIATQADRPVGFATCFIGYSTFRARPLLNIHDIAVIAERRGRGIASLLLEAVVEMAGSLGCCKVTLEVRSDNEAAQRAYARAGFVAADCDRFMEKPLSSNPVQGTDKGESGQA